MADRSLYDALGVPPTADAAEIRAAYLALARRHHPDRLGASPEVERSDAARRMAQINDAWTVLSDPGKRARYDLTLDDVEIPARVHDADRTFVPFDGADDPDPMDLDDTPFGPPTLSRRLTMLPAWLAIAAFGFIVIGGMAGLGPLFVVGLALVVFAAISFLILPLLALARSARRDDR